MMQVGFNRYLCGLSLLYNVFVAKFQTEMQGSDPDSDLDPLLLSALDVSRGQAGQLFD